MPKKVKWGKIGAPKSAKRKKWLAGLRKKKAGASGTKTKTKKKKKASSSKGVSYQQSWILW